MSSAKYYLTELLRRRDVKALCRILFDHDLAPGQVALVRSILFRDHRRFAVSAYTRYGKTFCIADAACLMILFSTRPLDVKLIGPTGDQASIVRGYIAKNIIHQPLLANLLDTDTKGIEKLKKEVSQRRFTFKNGCELAVFSAEGKADRLMGWGGDVIILDESCLIPKAVYDEKISRMLGDRPDESVLIELSNPWHKDNHFYQHWEDPAFHTVHIDWRQGIAEGRTTQDWIDEQRRQLPPSTFHVLYESLFPDQAEDQLIAWSWIQGAVVEQQPDVEGRVVYGLDVAEGGGDATVLSAVLHSDDMKVLLWQKSWFAPDTMASVTRVNAEVEKGCILAVDATGVGKGVADRLREMGHQVRELKTGRSASKKDQFTNLGSELMWGMRKDFEDGRVRLVAPGHELLEELTKYRFQAKSGRVHVEVDKRSGDSPDHADSLCYALGASPLVRMPKPLKAKRVI